MKLQANIREKDVFITIEAETDYERWQLKRIKDSNFVFNTWVTVVNEYYDDKPKSAEISIHCTELVPQKEKGQDTMCIDGQFQKYTKPENI